MYSCSLYCDFLPSAVETTLHISVGIYKTIRYILIVSFSLVPCYFGPLGPIDCSYITFLKVYFSFMMELSLGSVKQHVDQLTPVVSLDMESVKGSQDSIHSIVTCCRLDSPEWNPGGGEILCII